MVDFYDPVAKRDISISIEPKLLKIWDKIRCGKLIDKNEDRVYLVDGRERRGKSSFAIQQGKYIDPTLDNSRICLKPDKFLYQIKHAPKGTVVIFDEAFRGLSSKSTRSKVNKAIVEGLMEVGQRNLVIFIVLPTIFLLELYAAVLRSEALFHVYKTKDKRRAYKIYNWEKKKELYLRGKTKFYSYSKPKIKKAKGRFYILKTEKYPTGIPYETFDMDVYLKEKEESFRNIEKEEDEDNKWLEQRDLIIKGLYNIGLEKKYDEFKSHRKLSDWLERIGVGLTRTQVGNIVGKQGETPKTDN